MKLWVNGVETELESSTATLAQDGPLWQVHGDTGTHSAAVLRVGDDVLISYRGHTYEVRERATARRQAATAKSGELTAPMPGTVVAVHATVGDSVEAGFVVVVLEAMKTQMPFEAPFAGKVTKLPVSVGEAVAEGATLAVVEPE
jgi:biotin carboxyl carrier protein